MSSSHLKCVYSISLVTTCVFIEHTTPLYLEEVVGGGICVMNRTSCFVLFENKMK